MDNWISAPHGPRATIHQRRMGRYLLTVIVYERSVRWYARLADLFFGGPEGSVATLEEGQRAAESAALAMHREARRDARRRHAWHHRQGWVRREVQRG